MNLRLGHQQFPSCFWLGTGIWHPELGRFETNLDSFHTKELEQVIPLAALPVPGEAASIKLEFHQDSPTDSPAIPVQVAREQNNPWWYHVTTDMEAVWLDPDFTGKEVRKLGFCGHMFEEITGIELGKGEVSTFYLEITCTPIS